MCARLWIGRPLLGTAVAYLAAVVLVVMLASGCAGTQSSKRPDAGPRREPRANSYPLVLVHGAYGFGREELWGYPYWGGLVDLQHELVRRGYFTVTGAVGPVSSNWDRACELYACLKGGTADYGEAHARAFGHARYGRCYGGLYPEWGTPDPVTGRVRRIHLVGHSLGGQTARVLTQLLAEGSAEERAVASASFGELSPLFAGRHDWVHSITTISTPHDGTTATVRFQLGRSPMELVMGLFLAIAGTTRTAVYDFKLEQWGLERRPGDSVLEYHESVAASPIWENLRDSSLWDGSPEGARELNRWVRVQAGVFHFSWATEETCRDPLSGTQVPGWGMNPNLAALSQFLGSYTAHEPGKVPIDSSWWPNDGLVNTSSMDGPTLGSTDRIVDGRCTAVPARGVWNFMGVLESIDHLDIVGLDPLWREHPKGSGNLIDWYVSLAEMLTALPE